MSGDIVSSEVRTRMMRAVRQQGTKPELAIRRLLRELGISYRLGNRSLPGSPDIANRSGGWAIFVNGCFWHGHRNCAKTAGGPTGRVPITNDAFWRKKLNSNRVRDARKIRELRHRGFRVKIVWECDLRRPGVVKSELIHFIQGGDSK